MPPHFSVRLSYGQTAEWIRIPLGTEVRLGPGDIVLDGDPSPLHTKGHSSRPPFQPTACSGRHPRRSAFTHNQYCRLCSARRSALLAMLPYKCHPFSYYNAAIS